MKIRETVNTLDELVAMVRKHRTRGQKLYVRWAADSDSQRSRNCVTGDLEAGLSAQALIDDLGDDSWFENYPRRWVAMQIREYRFLRIKDPTIRPYILIGIENGIGGDGEPTLIEAKRIGAISEEAVQEAFEEKSLV